MKNLQIINSAKLMFWLSFIIGNVALFGYILFRAEEFAIFGFLFLYIATLINTIVIIGLLIYGFIRKEYLPDCFKATAILLINIPIAIVYAWIGLEIL